MIFVIRITYASETVSKIDASKIIPWKKQILVLPLVSKKTCLPEWYTLENSDTTKC